MNIVASVGSYTCCMFRCSLEKCSDPLGKTNANVIGDQFYHGKEVEFACPGDAVLHPSSSRKLRCRDGDWEGVIPSCQGSRYRH